MEGSINNVGNLLEKLGEGAISIGLKLVIAILIYLVGSFIIKRLIKGLGKLKSLKSIDTTAAVFLTTFAKAALYVLLVVSIIAFMGVLIS